MKEREALKLALEWLDTDDSQKIKMAKHFINKALAQPEQAQPELCKYGQEPKSCTSSPMDCQCALDATFAQPEQETVAVVDSTISGNIDWQCVVFPKDGTKLYTTPPQRTWVGLTDQEFAEACQMAERGNYLVAFQRIQAKLKEKNTK